MPQRRPAAARVRQPGSAMGNTTPVGTAASGWLGFSALLAVVLSSGASAQSFAPDVSLAVGMDYTSRHLGLTVEGRAGLGSGALVHHAGFSGSFAPTAGLDDCILSETGGCLGEEGMLWTGFYEPHVRVLRGGRLEPYVGGRLSVIRGWNGFGWGLGGVAGLEYGGRGAVLWRLDVVLDSIDMEPGGASGYAWDSMRIGVRTGVGWRF